MFYIFALDFVSRSAFHVKCEPFQRPLKKILLFLNNWPNCKILLVLI